MLFIVVLLPLYIKLRTECIFYLDELGVFVIYWCQDFWASLLDTLISDKGIKYVQSSKDQGMEQIELHIKAYQSTSDTTLRVQHIGT